MKLPARRFLSPDDLLKAGFLLLLVITLLPVLLAVSEHSSNQRARDAIRDENAVDLAVSTMRQADGAEADYLLSGNPSPHAASQGAVKALPGQLAAARAFLGNGPEQAVFAQLQTMVTARAAQIRAIDAKAQQGDVKGAIKLIGTPASVGAMLGMAVRHAQITQYEEQQITAAQTQAVRDNWLLFGAIFTAVAVTILLAWFAIHAQARRLRDLEVMKTELRLSNESLERKIAERTATLNASEYRFRQLAESLPGLVYMTDTDGKTTYVNPQSVAHFGMKEADLLGFGWVAALHPDDRAPCQAQWLSAVAAGQDFEIEYRLRGNDGLYRWFIDRAVPLRNSAGAITGWIGTSIDIHDRRSVEAALARANAELEERVAERSAELDRIFNLSTDMFTVNEMGGNFLAVSPAWERITGRRPEEALTHGITTFVHPEDKHTIIAARELIRLGLPASMENRFQRADGSWCWLAWRIVADLEARRVYGVARDITVERAREEQLRQSQKMEVVGQLTGGVAHDFNNLLTVIMGSLELLQRDAAEADIKAARRLAAAMDSARRAAALTHRLLAFSRRQPLAPQLLDVGRLLTGMSEMLHRTLGEPVALEITIPPGLWQVLADANQLENAILNLAVNARDAMPGGGSLSIAAENTQLSADNGDDVRPGGYVVIRVTDSGMGMAPEVMQRIFEPFFTTKPVGQGTGLGLAQVYGFIRQSGGHVRVQSMPDSGTIMCLYLPRSHSAVAPAGTPAPPPAPPLAGNGAVILVVEDEPGVRHYAAEVLQELGYQVLTAANAAEALALLESHPAIAMLFTDIVLGSAMNGGQLADTAQLRRPGIVTLFTTGYTAAGIVHNGQLDEGVNFIAKPFTPVALAEKIASLLSTSLLSTSQLSAGPAPKA